MTDNQIAAERLLAQIMASQTRWWKIHSRLLTYAFRDVPEDREPRTPAKWVAAQVACLMMDAQTWWINRRVDRRIHDRR